MDNLEKCRAKKVNDYLQTLVEQNSETLLHRGKKMRKKLYIYEKRKVRDKRVAR